LKTKNWLALVIIGTFAIPGSMAFAGRPDKDHEKHEDHDDGHWRDKHKDHDDDDDRRGYGFAEHDRDEIRGWYAANYRHLPPGLAKKDRLPPGLERRLVIREAFPPDLERQVYVVPVDLERELPPPPPDCERVVVGGHIVLRNRNTRIIVDIFHFE
jgi:Ni/Co efflux regulator RcnB